MAAVRAATVRRALVALVSLVIATGSFAAPVGAALPPDATATVDTILGLSRYANSTWGLQVEDLATGEVIESRNANLMFVPGSIMKNFSTVAALQEYGPDYRFRTPVYAHGNVDGKTLDGDLILVGSGDFSFGLRDQRDDTLAFTNFDHNEANNIPGVELVDGNPLSALNELGRAVKQHGIEQIDGDVVIDERLFEPYVDPADGPVNAVWVNENVIDLEIEPAQPGEAATVRWRPHVAPYHVTANVKTGDAGSETELTVDEKDGAISVDGTIAADAGTIVRDVQVSDPAAFARTAFVEALERAGVEVKARATGANPSKLLPKGRKYSRAERVAQHVSPPLSEYVKVILKVSYNRGAHLMVCMVAVHNGDRSCADGLAPEVDLIHQLGVGADDAFVFDGAGSSDYNRITPQGMNAFLRTVVDEPYAAPFRAGLPVLGVDGSLATTLPDSPAAGKAQAKTGTRATTTPYGQLILLAQTLVGYVTAASGRELAVSVMVNNMPFTQIEDILNVFADQGKILEAVQQSL